MTTEEELTEVRHKLNNPKLALFQTTKLQRRLGELLREKETANTHCPECGEVYDEPQPSDYICGACAFRLALQTVAEVKRPIALLEKPKERNDG